jgi:RNA polymerase sigma-70 factor (ECF subfamily)
VNEQVLAPPREAAPPMFDVGDKAMIHALLAGDRRAFIELVDRHHGSMVRVARTFVTTDAVAQEVAQEAWTGVLVGLARFEGRSSLKSWIFRIVVNCAKTRGHRERRSLPFSSFESSDDCETPAIDLDRFAGGRWSASPQPWADEKLTHSETLRFVEHALQALPSRQQAVMRLRDIDGVSSTEVSEILGISEGNQRVLLHRARSAVRRAVEQRFEETPISA